jgi:hypothetical protein
VKRGRLEHGEKRREAGRGAVNSGGGAEPEAALGEREARAWREAKRG